MSDDYLEEIRLQDHRQPLQQVLFSTAELDVVNRSFVCVLRSKGVPFEEFPIDDLNHTSIEDLRGADGWRKYRFCQTLCG